VTLQHDRLLQLIHAVKLPAVVDSLLHGPKWCYPPSCWGTCLAQCIRHSHSCVFIKIRLHGCLPNFTMIGTGVWVYGPKTLKIWNFTNKIAPKGRVNCAILTKFTGFMCALGLHKSVKFGWFISINDKIINNLHRWGIFGKIFDDPYSG